MSAALIRAVLWDADGVLQDTPAGVWELATAVVAQFPGAIIGAPIDEGRIRRAVDGLGLGDRVEDILEVWRTFDVMAPSLETVERVRAAGTRCYLATNQDAYRAACMREKAPYDKALDGTYYSCDVGAAKPSAAFFQHITADLGLAPHELLFLDDQPPNICGARHLGLHAERWSHGDGVPRLLEILDAHAIRLAGTQ